MTGQVNGGPLVWDRNYHLHCHIQVDNNTHTGPVAPGGDVHGPSDPHDGDSEEDEVAVVTSQVLYESPVDSQDYLCTSVSWPNSTGPNWLYWHPADDKGAVDPSDDEPGHWTTNASTPCATRGEVDPDLETCGVFGDDLREGRRAGTKNAPRACIQCDVTLELMDFDLWGWDPGDPLPADDGTPMWEWRIETRSGSNVPDFWTEFSGGDKVFSVDSFTGAISSGPKSRRFLRQPDGTYQRHVTLGASTIRERDPVGGVDHGFWVTNVPGLGDDDLQIYCDPGTPNNVHTMSAVTLVPPSGETGAWAVSVSWNWVVTEA